MPGAERIGIIITTILGIVGAILGGFLATALGFGDPIDEFFDIRRGLEQSPARWSSSSSGTRQQPTVA